MPLANFPILTYSGPSNGSINLVTGQRIGFGPGVWTINININTAISFKGVAGGASTTTTSGFGGGECTTDHSFTLLAAKTYTLTVGGTGAVTSLVNTTDAITLVSLNPGVGTIGGTGGTGNNRVAGGNGAGYPGTYGIGFSGSANANGTGGGGSGGGSGDNLADFTGGSGGDGGGPAGALGGANGQGNRPAVGGTSPAGNGQPGGNSSGNGGDIGFASGGGGGGDGISYAPIPGKYGGGGGGVGGGGGPNTGTFGLGGTGYAVIDVTGILTVTYFPGAILADSYSRHNQKVIKGF